MKTARDVIRDGIIKETGVTLAGVRADAAISALTATGHRILAPGELCPETLERAAQAVFAEKRIQGLARAHLVTVIRSLDTKGEADG